MTNAEAIETLRANYPDAYYEQLREAVDKAIKALETQEWIPRSERLPEYGEIVLCYYKNDGYGVNRIIDDENGEWLYDGVAAWMPLPEPYKERREE